MAEVVWFNAGPRTLLRPDDVVAVRLEGREIALYSIGGEVFATDDLCTHGAGRLSEGFLIDHCIECPLHQGQFDVRTGAPMCQPVTEALRCHPVRLEGDDVLVGIAV